MRQHLFQGRFSGAYAGFRHRLPGNRMFSWRSFYENIAFGLEAAGTPEAARKDEIMQLYRIGRACQVLNNPFRINYREHAPKSRHCTRLGH
jgi:hypothetical protein